MTRSLASNIAGLSIVVTTGFGCDAAPEPELDTTTRKAIVYAGGRDWGCRDCGFTNSPMLGTDGMFKLGEPAADAWGLRGIRDRRGRLYSVEIEDHALIATLDDQQIKGHHLKGWTLAFADATGQTFDVEIVRAEQVEDWVTGAPITTYSLAYYDGDDRTSICPGFDPQQTSVTLLFGETYDNDTKTVNPDETNYGTFACQGHALAKMKLMGYAPDDGYGSTWEQRQATLKMLTADYCGTGHRFTTFGQPLSWIDRIGLFTGDGTEDVADIEARWDLDGARCLSTPRLVPRDEVAAVCELPLCSQSLELGHGDWLTFSH